MPTAVQRRNHRIMRIVARGLIYGVPRAVIAEKLNKKVSFVRRVQDHPRFSSVMDEVEQEVLRTSEKAISALWEKGIKTVSKLMDSRNERTRLDAFREVKDLYRFQQGLGAGGLGGAVQEPEEGSDEEYLLSSPAIEAAFQVLEATPSDQSYVDVSVLEELSVSKKKL